MYSKYIKKDHTEVNKASQITGEINYWLHMNFGQS